MMEQDKFDALVKFITEQKLTEKYSIKDLVAEVHNLFQDYRISPEQEEDLYNIVDPENKEDSPAELWYNGYGCSEIWDFVQ